MYTFAPLMGAPENPAIAELNREAIESASELRRERRYPLFRPLSLTVGDQQPIRSFTRDVAMGGLGLLHRTPVELGPATAIVPNVEGSEVLIDLEIVRCAPCPGDWYLSGAKVMEFPADSQVMRPLMSLVDKKATRRVADRRAYFRPASIVTDGGRSVAWGFTRDMSDQGIGLLHDVPVKQGLTHVGVSALNGEELQMRVDIKWCRHCGDGWYISGGQFVPLMAEELPSLHL